MKLVIYLAIAVSTFLVTKQNNIDTFNIEFNNAKDSLCAPIIISPQNGLFIVNDTCIMSWTSGGKDAKYEILLSKDASFKYVAKASSNDTTLKKIFKTSEYGTYYWKVRAKNEKTVSTWSAPHSFNVGAQQIPIDNYNLRGCHGNCGACSHPCGRRRMPDEDYKIELKSPETD